MALAKIVFHHRGPGLCNPEISTNVVHHFMDVDGAHATLGSALSAVDKKAKLHPSLKEGFQKLYGYTSDAQGIRHALMDEPTLDLEDAKFMLVSCSAFVNYLVVKAQKAGIKI